MEEKTLVEIAVEFNIEINKLRNKINYEKRKGNAIGFKKDGVLYLNSNDIKQIKKYFGVIEKPIELNVEFNNEFAFLKKQLEEKDKQIFKLQQALDQQQILTKQAQDQNQNLLLENVEIKKELSEEKNKNFFQRLFKLLIFKERALRKV
ncbi:hypothetical protein [Lactococcus garvieae]|uniref:hypothetical protein n=1 Tax=Lactococcus garvieae TaxID=1363 RepID=UPI0013FD3FBF|nr:hypothetical protein [Lactococcus garvieae]NHI70592.1 hypothetical protein [Lactococcus garvieae]NHJ08380.1 hypothetical protein [Lactococcus garvieae]